MRASEETSSQYSPSSRRKRANLARPSGDVLSWPPGRWTCCPAVVPGFLQSPGYASALLSSIAAFREIRDDTQEAVAARMNRNRMLSDGNHRLSLLVEEEVLRHRIGSPSVMATQLAYLRKAMELPTVTLGVVPFTTERPVWPLEAFTVFDDERVMIELLSAQVTVTSPSEITLYVRAYEQLARLAVYGAGARSLIGDALAALG